MSTNNIAWASVALINEISTLLDFSDTPNYDLGEVNITLLKAKRILGSHLSQKLNINAYDVSLQGIKDVLVKIKMKLIDIDFADNKRKEKIDILRLDLILSYRVAQFESLFSINEIGVSVPEVSSYFESDEGKDFWIANFGEKLMIPWNTFYKVYCTTQRSNLTPDEQFTLRNFVDFTRDGFVTPYEFSLYLRWFGPLNSSISRVCDTINFGIMAGFIPAFEAETVLSDSIPGTYLFRLSKSNSSCFALALVSKDGKVKQTLLETNKNQSGAIPFNDSLYHSLTEFAKSQSKLVYPSKYCWLGVKDDDLAEEEDDGLVDVRVDTKKEKKNSIFIPRCVGRSHSDFCIVCLVNPLQIVFLECGHVSCCKSCAGNLIYCPMCKSKIERSVQIIKKTARSNVYGSNPVHLVM